MKIKLALLISFSVFLFASNLLAAPGRGPDSQPIRIVYVNHVEVESVIDYQPPLINGKTYLATDQKYFYTRDQLDWEILKSEAVGAVISFHMSGAFAEIAEVNGHAPIWNHRLTRGHTVGVHLHEFLRAGMHEYTYLTHPTEIQITQQWQENHDLVGSLVGESNLWIGESHWGSPTMWNQLGYSLKTNEAMAMLPEGSHIVWLVERDNQGIITYPHFPQIGQAGWHGPMNKRVFFDLRIPQLKKEFLMLYMEWLERERLNLEPQVWAWGWCNHGGRNTELYARDIEEMLGWLSNGFAEKTSMRGHKIAEFVSDHDLKGYYESYEQAGGQPLPSPKLNIADQFPYMASALTDAGVTADLTDRLGLPGVRLFELERKSAEHPPLGAPPRIYLLFRENDGVDLVDLRTILSSRGIHGPFARLFDVVNGGVALIQVDSVLAGSTPLVIEPQMGLEISALTPGQRAYFRATNAEPGKKVHFLYSLTGPGSTWVPALGDSLDLEPPIKWLGSVTADAQGTALLSIKVPGGTPPVDIWFQAIQATLDGVRKTNVVETAISSGLN